MVLSRIIILVFLMATPCCFSATGVVINELLASNSSGIRDEAGDADDWIELYNNTAAAVDLSAWSLSDDRDDPQKAVLPSGTTIPAQGFLLIWADGEPNQGALHLDFRLSNGGEWIGLFNPEEVLRDSLAFGPQLTDFSFGRYPDGSDTSFTRLLPTPGAANAPQFLYSCQVTPAEGVYDAPVTLHLATEAAEGEIHYTLNGENVTEDSEVCSGTLTLENSSVLKAQVFRQNTPVSPVSIHTYIINEEPKLPVLSVITPPRNLWNKSTGIYQNPLKEGRNWEREVWLTLMENSEVKFSVPAGLRIHGEISRTCEKKGLRVYFRDDYGLSILHYALFPQKPDLDNFERLLLYAPSHDQPSGNSNYAHITDALNHTLLHEIGGLISAYKPVSLYLNGEYWGIYWIREFIDEYYLASNYHISKEVDLLRYNCVSTPVVRAGDVTYWEETRNYIRSNDILKDSIYNYFADNYVNITNFIDYHLVNFFTANWDWFDENIDWYRSRTADPRWYWILWDTDKAWKWGEDINLLKSKTEDNKFYNLVLLRLLSNQSFRYRFINRYADLINTTFSTEHVLGVIENLCDMIRDEIPREENRWRDSSLPYWARWNRNVEQIKDVARKRPAKEREHVRNYFKEITGTFEITITAPQGKGQVQVNSLMIDTYPFVGTYFSGVPITVQAIPEPGYEFFAWEDTSLVQQPLLTHTFSTAQSFAAVFHPCAVKDTVVINEINYHSAAYHDPADWVELYNPTAASITLSGWIFSDDEKEDGFTLPPGVVLEPGGFLVLVRDTVRFHRMFPECEVYTGPLGFGLNSKGETLQLWDTSGILMDSLSYDNQSPWPNKPDGQGPTLELITPAADNSDPANWQTSQYFGSPGAANDQEKDFRSALCDSLLITEINYHSAPDTDAGDWLELYNGSAQSIELSGWQFWDENGDCYQFPPAVSLAGHTYMVLVQDSVLFHTVFPWCADFIGSLGFGLNNGGEFLCLQDSTGLIVDSLCYDDQPPWPPEPDGNGPTLALIDLSADNSDPANWQASTGKGTPGQPNTPQNPDTSQTGTNITPPLPLDFKLLANYPNPFNPETTIPYTLPRTAYVVVEIYDVLGRAVRTWEAKKPQGRHTLIWDGRNEQGEYMPAGVYIVRLRAGQFQDQKKMILLK